MTKKRKQLYLGWGIYFIVVIAYIAAVSLQPIWDRLEPHIIGLPFSVFNIVLAQLLICGGLCVMFAMDGKVVAEEKAKRKRGEKIDY
jgi:predicted PurR-regulated permease PerM